MSETSISSLSSIIFTNNSEIDKQFLLHLSDNQLKDVYKIDGYVGSLFDENFWQERFKQKFGVTLDTYKN